MLQIKEINTYPQIHSYYYYYYYILNYNNKENNFLLPVEKEWPMKITCTKDNLLYGVQVVQRAVSTKNPLPILSGILLKTENNKLKLSATDLELGIECKIPVNVIEEGSIILPAKYLSEIVRRLPDTKIDIETDEKNNLTQIKYEQSEFSIHGFSADDFPLLPSIDRKVKYAVKQDVFKNLIKQVVIASSTDENRPVFTGCLMEIEDNKICLIATNTHRLAFGEISINREETDFISVIVPGKTLSEISRIANSDKQEITFSIAENQIVFEIEDIIFISRLIEGQFPNYKQVIPQTHKTEVLVKARDLLEATERASLLAKDGSNVVKLQIQENTLIVTSNSPEIGRVHEEINIEIDGEETQIAFNSKYLLDVLKVIDSEKIYLEFSGSLSPCVIKPFAGDKYIYLILPVRTV